jgi:hypothetical protein
MTTLAHRIPLSVLPNRRTGIAIFLLMAPCIMGHSAESESWQRAPSEGQIRSLLNLPAIPKADIYEVVPTKVETALVWYLAKVPFAVLTCADADFLVGCHYNCDGSKKPVLVRAVYANGGTGNFTIRYDGRTLYIHHGSLGNLGAAKNLPLDRKSPINSHGNLRMGKFS